MAASRKFIRNQHLITKVGSRLRKARLDKGLTLFDLVEKSGVAYMQLWRIENGTVNTSISHIAKLCDALGISMADLFKPGRFP